jgi:hypothetical protein
MKKLLLCAALIAASFTSSAQVGINTATPEGVLDVVSTNSGFLFPRVATIVAVTTPVNGMIIYDVSTKCFKGFENGAWTSCFTNNAGAKEVISTTSRIWMDRNLGATQVATSSTDAASYGDLYQWGRAKDGHESRTSLTTTTYATTETAVDGKFITGSFTWTTFGDWDALWPSGLNDPCPSGYRIPTDAELNQEYTSWSINNAIGAFNSPLKLPLAGYRKNTNGDLGDVGSFGVYWSSTLSGFTTARELYFSAGIAAIVDDPHTYGFSVRCIKE